LAICWSGIDTQLNYKGFGQDKLALWRMALELIALRQTF
jgi:hypothetical protein